STGKAVSSTAFATTAPLDAELPDTSSSSVSKVKKVLVVDDSLTVRAMEKKVLQNHGYQVDVAVNGAEGWNAVRMNTYDLVITDIDMPRMNGIELIEQMRAYRSTQHLPVIVVSYKDREADQLAGLEAGANYYLTKSSFHNDGLITAVVDLIGAAI
ncbi:MAG: response regulator, partial [Cyanobacteria bacterium J06643_4]